jgi:AAA ATPase-like protein
MGSLLGRVRECADLDRLLAEVTGGASRVLVLRGEAGAGKSALLDHVSDQVGDWRVVTAVGVESEMELAYSGLQQICAPVLEVLDRLPAPQRDALEVVFGLSAGSAPDRFLVGLATLTLLAEAAESQPLVCIVDDAQWLDLASAQVLAFVARRLQAERIAIVCAARAGSGDEVLAGLPVLPVAGLDDDDARTLLVGNLHGALDSAVCDRIIAESHGNPLALLELPRTWSVADLAGGFGLPSVGPIADKIEQSYAQRLLRLPPQTQLLMLIAAAEPLGDRALLHRAAEILGVDPSSVNPAVDAQLLQVRRRVQFAHPLVRSATYRTANADDRQRVHRALAEATDAEIDPDRRAWHQARAVAAPDEDVAAELERSADRARSRGGLAAAAAFLTQAAELTPSPMRRVSRAIDAAFAHLQAGAFDTAHALARLADEGPLNELQHARIDLLRAQLAFTSRRGNEATPLLLEAARRFETLDAQLARETYLDAFIAALFGGRLNDRVGLRDVARAAQTTVGHQDDQSSAADLLLDAFAALAEDYQTASPLCRAAFRKLCGAETTAGERLRWVWLGAVIALEVWDDESAYVLSARNVQIARDSGALSELSSR